ncbi:MAG: Sec-independent protein translocase protein TatB [Rhodospirillales bacterium]|nr:Sec-independent protein translocase protein TatB [Rhodospirillales bacterium]
MFDIGWQEIIILMLIALIVVGPKDLPRIVKTAGQWMGKARGYARDFQRTIEEAADATEIDAVKKEIDEANRELSTARRDVAEGAEAVTRDVNEGADSMNKMFSEDAMASAKAAGAKPNGGEAPSGQAADADGGQAENAAAAAAESEPATAPATPAAETQGDGADGTPARGASA